MWEWILKILDWLRTLIGGHVEEQKKKEQQADEQQREEEQAIEDRYEKTKEQIPSDGAELVDYWRNRGVHGEASNHPPTKRNRTTDPK